MPDAHAGYGVRDTESVLQQHILVLRIDKDVKVVWSRIAFDRGAPKAARSSTLRWTPIQAGLQFPE